MNRYRVSFYDFTMMVCDRMSLLLSSINYTAVVTNVFFSNFKRSNFLKFERYHNVALFRELLLPNIAVCMWSNTDSVGWVACLNSIIIVLFVGDVCAH